MATINHAACKIDWKIKPQSSQIVNENESIQLNCEFQDTSTHNLQASSHFTIWYKDGASSNVLSLNDKLANLNDTQYEIKGKYNLVIKNVTKKDSGLYTCQLFQSNDLVASVNLTVLGKKRCIFWYYLGIKKWINRIWIVPLCFTAAGFYYVKRKFHVNYFFKCLLSKLKLTGCFVCKNRFLQFY